MKRKSTIAGALAAVLAITAGGRAGAAQQEPSGTAPADSVALPGYEQLDELVIEAQRPVMQSDGAKLTYNVDEDPAAGSSSALDILKKVPQISVDGDGNIRLNGSSNFKFQLNGLDNPMLKQYGDKIFEGMPASVIVKIEVITEPGAREDAEGTAGIINIVTERTRQNDGYSGRISLQGGNRALTPSLYAIMKKDKVTLSANVNYQWGFGDQKGEQETTVSYLDSSSPGWLYTKMGQKTTHHYGGGNLNMSWEPNESNLFTAGLDFFVLDADIRNIYGTTSRFLGPDNLLWSFSQDGNGKMNMGTLSVNAAYRHNFAPEGNYLVLTYLFNYGRNNIWIDRRYTEFENYTEEYPYQRQQSKTFNRGHTVQADYANNFGSEHHLMEVGAKGIFRRNTAISTYGYGTEVDNLHGLPDTDSNILQPQNIYAAYASYTGTFGSLGVLGGLRYEHTLMGVTERLGRRDSFRTHLNDVVPNAALTWNFSAASNLRLAYQMRISRPSIDQVNSFELSFSPYEVRRGNPDLTSERSHIVSLKYSAFGRVVGGTVGMEYNLTDNAINGFIFLENNDGINTVVTTYANIGRKQDIALTGFFNWNIISKMTFNLNGRLAYNTLRAPSEGFKNHGWSGNIGGSWNYGVEDCRFSAYGGWFSRTLTVQGYSTGYYYYGLSAARDFLADKSLTLSLSANNFLQKGMTFKGQTHTSNVIYDNTGRNLSAWNVGVSIAWKFGSLNTQVKKTGVDVKNDDINTSSNKGQSGL